MQPRPRQFVQVMGRQTLYEVAIITKVIDDYHVNLIVWCDSTNTFFPLKNVPHASVRENGSQYWCVAPEDE